MTVQTSAAVVAQIAASHAAWTPAPPPDVRATLTHDPDATPCWCGGCHRRRLASSRRNLSTPTPQGAGSMTDPDGYGSDLGHLVDPSGTGQGRWTAGRGGMWSDDPAGINRKDHLRP